MTHYLLKSKENLRRLFKIEFIPNKNKTVSFAVPSTALHNARVLLVHVINEKLETPLQIAAHS